MSIVRLFDSTATSTDFDSDKLYTNLKWPQPPADRPYVYINMASTVDGKIVIGEPGGTAKGVGGSTDQILFRRLQTQCDAALVGGVTLRASQVIYPANLPRYTVTRSGDVPLNNRFFTDAPDRVYVFAPKSVSESIARQIRTVAKLVRIGEDTVNLAEALAYMRREHGVKTLLCEGGPTINDQLLRARLADELFYTLAPKLKGGARLPTIITGDGLPPGEALPLELLSIYKDEDELYLRYLWKS